MVPASCNNEAIFNLFDVFWTKKNGSNDIQYLFTFELIGKMKLNRWEYAQVLFTLILHPIRCSSIFWRHFQVIKRLSQINEIQIFVCRFFSQCCCCYDGKKMKLLWNHIYLWGSIFLFHGEGILLVAKQLMYIRTIYKCL